MTQRERIAEILSRAGIPVDSAIVNDITAVYGDENQASKFETLGEYIARLDNSTEPKEIWRRRVLELCTTKNWSADNLTAALQGACKRFLTGDMNRFATIVLYFGWEVAVTDCGLDPKALDGSSSPQPAIVEKPMNPPAACDTPQSASAAPVDSPESIDSSKCC